MSTTDICCITLRLVLAIIPVLHGEKYCPQAVDAFKLQLLSQVYTEANFRLTFCLVLTVMQAACYSVDQTFGVRYANWVELICCLEMNLLLGLLSKTVRKRF